MFIAYDIKSGVEYAKICTSTRVGTRVCKKYINLGRVLDKERGIYRNRERGDYTYDITTNAYGEVPPDFSAPLKRRKESLILDFGDAYFLDQFIKANNLSASIDTQPNLKHMIITQNI